MSADRRAWTPEQERLLRELGGRVPPDELRAAIDAAGPPRSPRGIRCRARKLGVSLDRRPHWTRRQRALVYEFAGILPRAEVLARVNAVGPARTLAALQVYANDRGISLRVGARRPEPKYWRWTRHQEAMLRRLAGTLPADEIAARLNAAYGSARSGRSVRSRAQVLGLPLALRTIGLMELARILPVGLETLVRWVDGGLLVAARRGYRGSPWCFREADVEAFLKAHPELVDWRRVRAGRWRDVARAASLRAGFLDVGDVARRLGVAHQRVTDWCAAGLVPGAVRTGGGERRCRRWRIPTAALPSIERLVAERIDRRRAS